VDVWDNIEAEGEFADFPECWAAPEDVERACENLIGLIDANNETALKACEIYVSGRLSDDDSRLQDNSWREEREKEFVEELHRLAENAAKCRERGITKVGFLIYM
jgi:hypothetical protein